MRVAIHQPTFFPWIGLLHKIRQCDLFIFFDHVQLPRGKSWLTRNKILLQGQVHWFTIPIYKKGLGLQPIDSTRINYEQHFLRKHFGTLQGAYGNSPFFDTYYDQIVAHYERGYALLNDFNQAFIKYLCRELGIATQFITSRELVKENNALAPLLGNDLVLELCKTVGATTYVSGSGCLDFIRPETFEQNDIDFYFQHFVYKPYPQQADGQPFVSHLSCLDTLFHVGMAGIRDLIAPDMLSRPIEGPSPLPGVAL